MQLSDSSKVQSDALLDKNLRVLGMVEFDEMLREVHPLFGFNLVGFDEILQNNMRGRRQKEEE